jgi:threonine dehydrogenase-like Zn-dependent dehydrogenase
MEKETMQAIVAHAPGDYRFERLPIPEAGDGDIVIRVEACGICAGDLKCFQGGKRFWGSGGEGKYVEEPFVPGHEFSGRIVSVGSERAASGFSVGDRVIAEQIVPCGSCRFCASGDYWMCESHDVFGFKSRLPGGFAEYALLPRAALVHRVPESLSMEQAALIEPYSCSLHAVKRGKIGSGDVVVISGAGPLGLGMVASARRLGPKKLIVLDYKRERLALAKSMGADIVLRPGEDDAEGIIRAETGGYGCDVYIEATGHPQSVVQGLRMIRKLGRFVEFSVFNDDVTCDFSVIGDGKELDIYGVSLSPDCYEEVIRGFEGGDFPSAGMVTEVFPLSAFEAAFEAAKGGGGSVKVLLSGTSAA